MPKKKLTFAQIARRVSPSISTTGLKLNTSDQTADGTISDTSDVIFASGTLKLTLPTATGKLGKTYNIKNTGTGIVTVDGTGTETIDGGLTAVIESQYEAITVASDGSNWNII